MPPIIHERQFAGRVDRSVEVSRDITVHHLSHQPLQVIAMHEHELARVAIMLEGALREANGQCVEEIGPRAVIFWPPGSVHEDRFGTAPNRCVQIELSERAFAAANIRRVFPRPPVTVMGEELLDGAVRALLLELDHADVASPTAIEGAIYALLARAHRVLQGESSPRADFARAAAFIARNFHRRLSVAEIGAAAGLSPRTIAQRFREELGISPAEYLRRARLEAAATRLATTDLPAGRIALECGFYDQAHLTREFHREFGVAPRAYRRNLRTHGRIE